MEKSLLEMLREFIAANASLFIKLGIFALILWLILYLIKLLAKNLNRRIEAADTSEEQKARLRTIENVTLTTLRAIVISIMVLIVLETIGFDLSPLLASAGIAGLAISLGAQALIKDYIGGLLIVIENQFGVGDLVEIQGNKGTVEKITLRQVALREYSGRLITISNGDVRTVKNFSRDWMRAIVDLYVDFDVNIGDVVQALETAMQAAYQDDSVKALLLEPPVVVGWNSMNEWGVQIRLAARSPAGKQGDAEPLLRRYALDHLSQRGIQLAHPSRDTHFQK
jgi:small conductance mechanosensitive channel